MCKRLLIAVLLVMGMVLPLAAQEAEWLAWLYDGETGSVTVVDSSGVVTETFTLPLPTGFDSYPRRAAVSRDAALTAYVVYNSQTFQGALTLSRKGQLAAAYNLPLTFSDSFEFVADWTVFSDDQTALAFGYSLEGGGWAVIVLDAQTGTVTHILRGDDPLVAVLGLEGGFGLTPVIRHFSGREIIFTMVQSGTEGASEYSSYNWNIDSNALTKNLAYPGLDADTFPLTGEVVMTLPDDRLPDEPEAFTFFQANSLQVFDPLTGGRFPFFNAPDATLFSPRFIQNGELVLVDSTTNQDTYQWLVAGRDGTLVGPLPSAVQIDDVRGVGDGFIYTTTAFSQGATALVFVNTRDGLDAGIPVWTGTAGSRPLIIYAADTAVRAQSAYTPWTKLADAVYAPGVAPGIAPAGGQPLLTPQAVSPLDIAPATPVLFRALTVGGLATVSTTDGDQLNVRSGPGTGFEIVIKLDNGTRVSISDGPRSADGFTWWKLRLGGGVEGWAVESVPNDAGGRLQTLLPG